MGSQEVSKPFNPILEWLKALKEPTFKDPVASLCDYIVLEDDSDRDRLIMALKKWFVGSIKTLLDKYTHKQCVVFSGPSGIGKTPFFRALLPAELYENYFKSIQVFNPASKDSMQMLTRYFIGLIDEVDKFMSDKTNERNHKALMSIDKVNDRLPYGAVDVFRKRIVSFVGTCNESTFLNDPTGTQRFTVFAVKGFWNSRAGFSGENSIEHFMAKNIWQIWSWAYRAYLDGFDPEYTAQEIKENEAKNEMYKYDSPEFDTLQEYLEIGSKEDQDEFLNTTQLCKYLNSKQSDIIFNNARLGRALTRLGFKKERKGRNQKGYYVKKLL